MAAATLVLGVEQDVALEAIALDQREVIVPTGTRWIRGRLRGTEDWFYQRTGVDGGARGANFETYPGNGTTTLRAPDSGLGATVVRFPRSVFISSDLAGGTIELTAMEESG